MAKNKIPILREKVYDKLAREYDFTEILMPYREGGSSDHPVERTWGLIISWLLDKKKYPLDVIGAAIMLTIDHIKREGDFKGDGKFGSAGNQFDQTLLGICDQIQKQKLVDLTYKSIVESRTPHMQLFISGQVFNSIPWWVKIFTWSYWQFKKIRRKSGTPKRS
jgi:hypothetical protein